jgi:hypothetical protein
VLQTRESIATTSAHTPPPGFVEPVPEFYQRFAAVVEATSNELEKAGALDADAVESALVYLQMADGIGRAGWDRAKDAKTEEVQIDEMLLRTKFADLAVIESPIASEKDLLRFFRGDPLPREWAEMRAMLEVAAEKLLADRPDSTLLLPRRHRYLSTPTRELWNELAGVVHRLEAMSHKQLRGLDWNADEEQFIRGFGPRLAHLMFYEAHAWMMPRDDAPRVAPVATNPNIDRTLHVGIGRPRELLVLYPWKGVPVLCRGAVLPYHEHASAERLDDAAWRALLDSDSAPQPPTWLRAMYGER